jgi:hypothetical protein
MQTTFAAPRTLIVVSALVTDALDFIDVPLYFCHELLSSCTVYTGVQNEYSEYTFLGLIEC